jgi:HK97 family phage major capsid protein
MHTLQQIEARLAEIRGLLDAPDADLNALEAEVTELEEQRKALIEASEKRAAIKARVAGGNDPIVRSFAPDLGGHVEDRTFGPESAEYRAAWLKRLQGKDLNEIEERAYASGDAGNAVPTLVADKFFEKLKKIAPMLNEITLMRVPGNLKFTVEGTNVAATAGHTENTAVTPAADTVVNVSLGGKEFIKVITVSLAARAMSIDSFEGWLVQMLSRDIARAIDNYILNDTTNGIAVLTTWTSSTNQIVNTAGLTYANLVSLIALLPAGYDANAKFVMHKKTLWNSIASIVDSAGNPVLMRDVENGMAPRLLGYPVIVDDYVTTANSAIYLGDFETVVGNFSQDVSVESSTQSAFRSAGVDYRGFAIFDSKGANTEAIVRYVSTTA